MQEEEGVTEEVKGKAPPLPPLKQRNCSSLSYRFFFMMLESLVGDTLMQKWLQNQAHLKFHTMIGSSNHVSFSVQVRF